MSTRPATTAHRTPSTLTSATPATLPSVRLERPMDPAGAVENARDTLGVD